jgi:hypothetical protein
MTDKADAPLDPYEELDTSQFPTEFHPNRFKLLLAAVMQGAIALFVSWKWTQTAAGDPLVPALCVVLVGFAWLFWREARDPRPILRVTDEGLEDRRHGFAPWSKIARYDYKKSFFSPVFGYSLKPGMSPERATTIHMLQGALNRLSGRPTRVWQKSMVAGGLEPMLLACRLKRPDLEGKP